jgi:hypothetical protein
VGVNVKRLYFLVPDVDNAAQISNALKDIGVVEEGVHVVVKDHDKLQMTQLLEAGIVEKTDFLGALMKGGIAGGVAGLLAGTLLVTFPPEEFIIGGGTILAFTLFGILFGAWSSSMIGISIPNPTVEKLERAIEAGGIMMLVDIPREKENEVLDFMHTYHPETTIHGMQIASK